MPPAAFTLTVVATNDLHGRLGMLPWLGGHLANLRASRSSVLLVDAGDLFQGTLESNQDEGATVVRAYNHLGYDAVAVGNHEYDFGPEGPAVFARGPGEDPQGALQARAREARFSFLSANVVRAGTSQRPPWARVTASVVVARGVPVGLVGVSTEDTLTTTLAMNVRGLAVLPLAETVTSEARALRASGARVVVVLAHAGGRCRRFTDPEDLSSCDGAQEVFALARALPAGLVDVIAAGHTHQGIAHRVNGVAVLESFSQGRAFGRVDLTVDPSRGVTGARVFPPRDLCAERGGDEPDPERCHPEPYEGRPVLRDEALQALVAPSLERARGARDRPLGVTVEAPVVTRYNQESALTNLVATMTLRASPGADVGVMNAGGVRVDLPAGALTYGRLYATLPFENRLVTVRMRGRALRAALEENARSDAGVLGVAGVRVTVRCDGGVLAQVTRDDGRAVTDDEVLTVATNDFLATGALRRHLEAPLDEAQALDAPVLRDAVGEALAREAPVLRGGDPRWYDPARPRWALPSARPVRCGR